MIEMPASTKNIVSVLEVNCGSQVRKDEFLQGLYREEIDCFVIKPSYKYDEDGQPTWLAFNIEVFKGGEFKKTFEEKKTDSK